VCVRRRSASLGRGRRWRGRGCTDRGRGGSRRGSGRRDHGLSIEGAALVLNVRHAGILAQLVSDVVGDAFGEGLLADEGRHSLSVVVQARRGAVLADAGEDQSVLREADCDQQLRKARGGWAPMAGAIEAQKGGNGDLPECSCFPWEKWGRGAYRYWSHPGTKLLNRVRTLHRRCRDGRGRHLTFLRKRDYGHVDGIICAGGSSVLGRNGSGQGREGEESDRIAHLCR
jgi:hypothetical protein